MAGARPGALAGTVIAIALVAAGCARAPAPLATRPIAPDLVVVLPPRDGTVGAVTVTQGGAQRTLEGAYATARISPGRLETGTISEPEVRAIFGPALDAQPPRPVSFVLFFAFGTDTFTPESTQALGAIAREVAQRPAAEIVVIGHTDRVGTDQQNDALSLQRAERVRGEFVRLGVSPERITTVGRGEREPLVPTDDEVPEPRNRRVEITVR